MKRRCWEYFWVCWRFFLPMHKLMAYSYFCIKWWIGTSSTTIIMATSLWRVIRFNENVYGYICTNLWIAYFPSTVTMKKSQKKTISNVHHSILWIPLIYTIATSLTLSYTSVTVISPSSIILLTHLYTISTTSMCFLRSVILLISPP